jgi:hypothetical protein
MRGLRPPKRPAGKSDCCGIDPYSAGPGGLPQRPVLSIPTLIGAAEAESRARAASQAAAPLKPGVTAFTPNGRALLFSEGELSFLLGGLA